jgi:AcrR family transcriptional regulator
MAAGLDVNRSRDIGWKDMTEQDRSLQSNEPGGRLRIVRVAHPLFVEHGYVAVSMQQIADASGIHKATLYHYFQHKADLFKAVMLLEVDGLQADLRQAIAQGDTIREQLVEVAWRLFQRSGADFGRLMSDVHEHLEGDIRAELRKVQAYPWDDLEGIFIEAAARGELSEVDEYLAVSMFTGVLWGQIWSRKMDRTTEPFTEELAGRLVDVLLAGLQHSPAALRSDSVDVLI